jgi:tetrapyrrole methylase family protein / MazG family protein
MAEPSVTTFEELLAIVSRLRGPDGCAWDREQTPTSLRSDLVEEAYECVAAINAGDDGNLAEELGDLLLLIALISRIKAEEGRFGIEEVLEGICSKLIRRHPHVFSGETGRSVEEILVRWDEIKREEKGRAVPASVLSGIPDALPPLERSAALQKKASKVGFDWTEPAPVWKKLAEEIEETRQAVASGDSRAIEREIGDILFTVANLARLLGVDPSLALLGTNARFHERFAAVEAKLSALGVTPSAAGLPLMDRLWDEVKAEQKRKDTGQAEAKTAPKKD